MIHFLLKTLLYIVLLSVITTALWIVLVGEQPDFAVFKEIAQKAFDK